MYKDILLPVDLSSEASWEKALPTAVEYCQAFGSKLHLLTVVPDYGMSIVGQYFPKDYEQQVLEGAQEKLHAFAKDHVPDSVQVQHIIGHGTVYREIQRVADEIDVDLIIMASHRPELSDYLIGPNASRVVRHVQRSVLVVR